MKKNQEKLNNGLGTLSNEEVHLIELIRNKYRYGQIVIQVHDGQPKYVEKTVERERI